MKVNTPLLAALGLIIICILITFGKGIGTPPDISKNIINILSVILTAISLISIIVFRQFLEKSSSKHNTAILLSILLSLISLITYSYIYSRLVVCSEVLPIGENCLCFPAFSGVEIEKLVEEAGSKTQTLELFGIDYMREKINSQDNNSYFLLTKMLFIALYSICLASFSMVLLLILLKILPARIATESAEKFGFKKISKLIANDRLDLAFLQIKNSTLIARDESLYNEIIILESRYKKNQKENNIGIISQQEYSIELNKIKKALLDFVQGQEKY